MTYEFVHGWSFSHGVPFLGNEKNKWIGSAESMAWQDWRDAIRQSRYTGKEAERKIDRDETRQEACCWREVGPENLDL
jgi:hypothetical protein